MKDDKIIMLTRDFTPNGFLMGVSAEAFWFSGQPDTPFLVLYIHEISSIY